MNNIMDYLYGPLNKNWCIFFYIASIFAFLSIFFYLFFFIISIKQKTLAIIFLLLSLISVLGYIQFRLLHGMCINSSKPA